MAEITGTIYANDGRIGSLTIESDNANKITTLTVPSDETLAICFINSDKNPQTALEVSENQASFYGAINALDGGNIGGFTIKDGVLVSADGENIKLDGKGGSIIANTITLGTGAVIKDYIALGTAIIQNPNGGNSNNRPFISAGNGTLELYQGGSIKAGNITINGPESIISGTNRLLTL